MVQLNNMAYSCLSMNRIYQWRIYIYMCVIHVATMAYLEAKKIRWHKLAARQLPLAINCNCMQFLVSTAARNALSLLVTCHIFPICQACVEGIQH